MKSSQTQSTIVLLFVVSVIVHDSNLFAQAESVPDPPSFQFGLFIGYNTVYTDLEAFQYTEMSPVGTYYEDAVRQYRPYFGQIVLDVRARKALLPKWYISGHVGGAWAPGLVNFLPEIQTNMIFDPVEVDPLQVEFLVGLFAQRAESRFIGGVQGGIAIGLVSYPTVELTVQRPFDPLTSEWWPSRSGGFVETSIHYWILRVGVVFTTSL